MSGSSSSTSGWSKRGSLYWELEERTGRKGPDRWVKKQAHGCRFIERANAAAVAKRTGARVVHIVAADQAGKEGVCADCKGKPCNCTFP